MTDTFKSPPTPLSPSDFGSHSDYKRRVNGSARSNCVGSLRASLRKNLLARLNPAPATRRRARLLLRLPSFRQLLRAVQERKTETFFVPHQPALRRASISLLSFYA